MNEETNGFCPYSGVYLIDKMGKVLVQATTRVNSEKIMLNEESQSQDSWPRRKSR